MIVVAIRDLKVDAFLAPLAVRTLGEAERFFTTLINDRTTEFAKYPEDYVLFEIGSWDEKDGRLESCSVPHRLCDGLAVVRKD